MGDARTKRTVRPSYDPGLATLIEGKEPTSSQRAASFCRVAMDRHGRLLMWVKSG
jgi:hypothetical protein